MSFKDHVLNYLTEEIILPDKDTFLFGKDNKGKLIPNKKNNIVNTSRHPIWYAKIMRSNPELVKYIYDKLVDKISKQIPITQDLSNYIEKNAAAIVKNLYKDNTTKPDETGKLKERFSTFPISDYNQNVGKLQTTHFDTGIDNIFTVDDVVNKVKDNIIYKYKSGSRGIDINVPKATYSDASNDVNKKYIAPEMFNSLLLGPEIGMGNKFDPNKIRFLQGKNPQNFKKFIDDLFVDQSDDSLLLVNPTVFNQFNSIQNPQVLRYLQNKLRNKNISLGNMTAINNSNDKNIINPFDYWYMTPHETEHCVNCGSDVELDNYYNKDVKNKFVCKGPNCGAKFNRSGYPPNEGKLIHTLNSDLEHEVVSLDDPKKPLNLDVEGIQDCFVFNKDHCVELLESLNYSDVNKIDLYNVVDSPLCCFFELCKILDRDKAYIVSDYLYL